MGLGDDGIVEHGDNLINAFCIPFEQREFLTSEITVMVRGDPPWVGEIYMMPDSGPGTTYRYIGAEPKILHGWESLGDMGWMDAEGYLYLTDRTTDMILRGGANIYPAEVEAAIDSHPKVRSSAVIGVPDEDLGQRVHAIVDAPEGVTDEELLLHLADRLVQYKIPQSFEFVSEPLRDDAGKVRRSALRDQWLNATMAGANRPVRDEA